VLRQQLSDATTGPTQGKVARSLRDHMGIRHGRPRHPCPAAAALAEGISNAVAPAPSTSVIAALTASAFILLVLVVFIVLAFPLREVRPAL
jgi:hypothetical protein